MEFTAVAGSCFLTADYTTYACGVQIDAAEESGLRIGGP